MSALEVELSRRTRKLLAQALRDENAARGIRLGPVVARISYSRDGDDEFLTVTFHGRRIYEEQDGRSIRLGVHFIDKIHMAVLELRKHMLLDDIADGIEPPLDSILERDEF